MPKCQGRMLTSSQSKNGNVSLLFATVPRSFFRRESSLGHLLLLELLCFLYIRTRDLLPKENRVFKRPPLSLVVVFPHFDIFFPRVPTKGRRSIYAERATYAREKKLTTRHEIMSRTIDREMLRNSDVRTG